MKLVQPMQEWAKRNETKKNSIRPVSAYCCQNERRGKERAAEDWLAVPAQGQVLGLLNDLVLAVFALTLTDLLLLFLFPALLSPRLLALHVFVSEMSLLLCQGHEWKGRWEKGAEQKRKFPVFPITFVDPSFLRIKFSFSHNKRKVLLSNRIPLQQTFPDLKGKVKTKQKNGKS